MFEIIVYLENRVEKILYYSEFTAKLQTNKIGKCKDVLEVITIDTTTGEIIIHYRNQKCIWLNGMEL